MSPRAADFASKPPGRRKNPESVYYPPNRPQEHEEIECLRSVSEKIEEILNGPKNDGGRLRKLHKRVDEPITLEELNDYLSSAKKGTAPGMSGIPIELWAWAGEKVKEELVAIFNECLQRGVIPEIWEKRLIRPLAKSTEAVGLDDIRPITLLEVPQKLLTGIITERINKIWNKNDVLHESQMAFLHGKGCYQAMERIRGIMHDCKRVNMEGRQKEAHILYVDLAKAHDSVEYWARCDERL